MPNLAVDLVVDRVDFVEEGANSAAFIELYKRKESREFMDVNEIIGQLKPEHAETVSKAISDLNDEVAKAKADCEKACAERDEAKADCEKACAERDEAKKECEDAKKAASGTISFDETETFKSMPEAAQKYLQQLRAQKEAAEDAVRKSKEAEIESAAIATAATLKAIPVDQGKLVSIIKSASPDVLELLTTVNAAIEGAVLGEVGKSRGGAATHDAWEKIEAMATEVAKSRGVTQQKAISLVCQENPELYSEYVRGGNE